MLVCMKRVYADLICCERHDKFLCFTAHEAPPSDTMAPSMAGDVSYMLIINVFLHSLFKYVTPTEQGLCLGGSNSKARTVQAEELSVSYALGSEMLVCVFEVRKDRGRSRERCRCYRVQCAHFPRHQIQVNSGEESHKCHLTE